VIGFDSAIQARSGTFSRRLDCLNHTVKQNWLELNRLFMKSRMNIIIAAQMDLLSTDMQADRDAGHASPDAHDSGHFTVKSR
jgi:hypothetical protein